MSGKPKFTKFRNRRTSNERSRERDPPSFDLGESTASLRQRSEGKDDVGFDNRPGRPGPSSRERYSHDRRGGPSRRGGPPPGLRGKAIGMYYRNLQAQKNAAEPQVRGPKHRLQIRLDPYIEKDIQELLNTVRKSTPGSSSNFKVKQESEPPLDPTEQARLKLENSEYAKVFLDSKMEVSSSFSKPVSSNVKLEGGSVEDEWTTVNKRPREKATTSESALEPRPKSPKSSCFDQYHNLKDSMFKRNFLQSITESIEDKLDRVLRSQSALEKNPELDEKLYDSLIAKRNSQRYREMLGFREKLPAYSMKDEIVDLVRNNQVIVVSGETGCGKTTQVAQFLLDDQILQKNGSTCHIVCTQPRRISATSVAQRVAAERNENLGTESVGYQIRLEKALPAQQGSILFCTTGVLLQHMQSDPALCDVSHVVLDEVHERDTVCDFVITLLRDVIAKRPDLKLILMSATLNADHFSRYYNNCPCINIPGFTYPVEELYLEDVLEMTQFRFRPARVTNSKWKKYTRAGREMRNKEQAFSELIEPYVRNLDPTKYSPETRQALLNIESENLNCDLIAQLIVDICSNKPDGAILVFLPGWTDISNLNKILVTDKFFSSSCHLIIPLHSMMPTTVQHSVFDRPPPGVRKIILATNIAETSITIDDVVYVIDTGKIKMKQYDVESNIQTLLPEWVSLANARQRRGRAGRVQPGICYHLYSRAREMSFSNYPLPEMLRSRLEEVILTAKYQQVGMIKSFLGRVMNPPDPRVVDCALKLLVTMNALDSKENLTPLGYHLAKLPLDPQTGKMILLGALFSCVNPIFSIAASLSFKDAFQTPLGKEKQVDERKQHLADGSKSDHLLLADVMRMWEQAESRGDGQGFCYKNFLSKNTLGLLKDMKGQFARYLCEMKFLSSENPNDPESNINSDNRSLIKAIICAGLYPNVAFVHKASMCKYGVRQRMSTMEERKVSLHPRSINAQAVDFHSPFVVFHLKLKSTQIYLHDSTVVYPMPLLFFGENLQFFVENGVDMVAVNDYIRFRCKEETADLIMELRHHMSAVLEEKVCHPETVRWSDPHSRESSILRAIVNLIAYEDKQIMDGYDYSDDDSDD